MALVKNGTIMGISFEGEFNDGKEMDRLAPILMMALHSEWFYQ